MMECMIMMMNVMIEFNYEIDEISDLSSIMDSVI